MTGLSLGSQLSGLASFGKLLHVAHADCSGFCESPTRGRRDRKARRTSLRSSRFTTKHESVLDRATAQRTAVQSAKGRLLRKVISSILRHIESGSETSALSSQRPHGPPMANPTPSIRVAPPDGAGNPIPERFQG